MCNVPKLSHYFPLRGRRLRSLLRGPCAADLLCCVQQDCPSVHPLPQLCRAQQQAGHGLSGEEETASASQTCVRTCDTEALQKLELFPSLSRVNEAVRPPAGGLMRLWILRSHEVRFSGLHQQALQGALPPPRQVLAAATSQWRSTRRQCCHTSFCGRGALLYGFCLSKSRGNGIT